MLQLYANNAKTTLASAITSTQTSITLAPGTGALFPIPVTGVSWFTLTLTSATNPTLYEITYCTARSGDTLTITRGEEGTTAQPFNLGDIAGNYDTAGVMNNLVQADQWQDNYYGLATATGTVNAITATIPSNFTSIPNGMAITLFASGANTGPVTLQVTLGSTVTSPLPIIKGNNSPLIAGDIPLAGYPLTLVYSQILNSWVITDIAVNLSPYATLLSPAFTGTPTAPTPAINNNSTEIATTAYVQNNLANYAPIYQPNFTGNPTINGQLALALNSVNLNANGYIKLNDGFIIQWGETGSINIANNNSGSYATSFPTAFPNACLMVVGGAGSFGQITSGQQTGVFSISGWNTTSFSWMFLSPNNGNGGATVHGNYIAIGF